MKHDFSKFEPIKFREHCFWEDLVETAGVFAYAQHGLVRCAVVSKARVSKQRMIQYFEFVPWMLN